MKLHCLNFNFATVLLKLCILTVLKLHSCIYVVKNTKINIFYLITSL